MPIEAYEEFDVSDPSGTPTIYVPPSPAVCSVPLGNIHPGEEIGILIGVTDSALKCGPEPAISHPGGSSGSSGESGSSRGSGAAPANATTTIPVPTATPTPTDSPTPSASPSPSASSTPNPSATETHGSSGGGLPWWIWLLIIVGVLVLAAVGFVIFRIRI
jgi:hypothetical protein